MNLSTTDQKQLDFAWFDFSSAQLWRNLKSVHKRGCELNANLLQQLYIFDVEKTAEEELRSDLVQQHGCELNANLLQQ